MWKEDLRASTDAGRTAAANKRAELERDGQPIDELLACDTEAQDRTSLPSSVKTYVPWPDGKWGIVYLIARDRGEHRPQPLTDRRLREGYKAASMIAELYDWETAKAWLFGTNTRLDDQSPVEVLGTAKTDQEFTDVARAAKQFASSDG